MIHVCDFTGVRVRRVLRVVGWRRRIGRVRIEDVHPREPLALLTADPFARHRDDSFRPPLGEGEVSLRHLASSHIVVAVEPLCETELPIERKGADERSSGEAVLFSALGECDGVVVQAEAGVVANTMLEGIVPGHDAGVRRQGDDGVRVREREADAFGGEAIEIGRRGASTVAAERVATQGVDRDQQHVLIRRSGPSRLLDGVATARRRRQPGESRQRLRQSASWRAQTIW